MIVSTKLLETNLILMMKEFNALQFEAKDISDMYWKESVSSDLSPLLGSDAATIETKNTKDELVNMLTFAEQVDKFFQNSALTTADYLQTIMRSLYGNDERTPTKLSEPVEEFGRKTKEFATNCHSLYLRAKENEQIYFDNEIGDIVAVLDSQRIVPGSQVTAADVSNAITLLQQWKNLIGNSATTAADYSVTVSRWLLY